LADTNGEIRRVPGGLCFFGDVAAGSEICKRQVGVDLTAFVEEFVEVSIGEQSPVQATARSHVLRMAADRRCAVLRQSVVPLRMAGEPIDFIEIINQKSSHLRGWNADAVQIYLLTAVVGSQPDQVAFVGDYVIELVLAVEATNRRV